MLSSPTPNHHLMVYLYIYIYTYIIINTVAGLCRDMALPAAPGPDPVERSRGTYPTAHAQYILQGVDAHQCPPMYVDVLPRSISGGARAPLRLPPVLAGHAQLHRCQLSFILFENNNQNGERRELTRGFGGFCVVWNVNRGEVGHAGDQGHHGNGTRTCSTLHWAPTLQHRGDGGNSSLTVFVCVSSHVKTLQRYRPRMTIGHQTRPVLTVTLRAEDAIMTLDPPSRA